MILLFPPPIIMCYFVCYKQCIEPECYRFLTSASTFFQLICDFISLVNYSALLKCSVCASLIYMLHQCLIFICLFC